MFIHICDTMDEILPEPEDREKKKSVQLIDEEILKKIWRELIAIKEKVNASEPTEKIKIILQDFSSDPPTEYYFSDWHTFSIFMVMSERKAVFLGTKVESGLRMFYFKMESLR